MTIEKNQELKNFTLVAHWKNSCSILDKTPQNILQTDNFYYYPHTKCNY